MSPPICKHCGQPIGPSSLRGGVYLSAQRRRVFDAIKKSPGCSALELAEFLYPGTPSAAGARRVIQTVHHINDQLASTNVRIKKCGYRIEGEEMQARLDPPFNPTPYLDQLKLKSGGKK